MTYQSKSQVGWVAFLLFEQFLKLLWGVSLERLRVQRAQDWFRTRYRASLLPWTSTLERREWWCRKLLVFSARKGTRDNANKATLMDGCQLLTFFPISVACQTQKCHSLNHLHSWNPDAHTSQINHSYLVTVILRGREQKRREEHAHVDDDGRRKLIRYRLFDASKNK